MWTIAMPLFLVMFVAGGGWLLWPPASPPSEPTRHLALQTPPQVPAETRPSPTETRPETEQTSPQPEVAAPPIAAPTAETSPPRAVPESPAFTIETANEQHILNHVSNEAAPDLTVFRFTANPRILVLDFSSLRDQGRMLNRAAAFVEKTGLPHDRLLSDGELDTAVRAGGDTVETFYYGHDYGATALVHFFALADRDNLRLLSEEETLRRLLRQEGWFEPSARAGLISIPQVGADEHVTPSARATILHHELSHGEYFTNPAYAAFVHRFWKQTLTDGERDRIRRHLHSLGYDSAIEDVMENEAQAYLMFTDGAEFFTPARIGMSKGRLAELRSGFFRSMPGGWLRDSLGQFLSINKTAASPRH